MLETSQAERPSHHRQRAADSRCRDARASGGQADQACQEISGPDFDPRVGCRRMDQREKRRQDHGAAGGARQHHRDQGVRRGRRRRPSRHWSISSPQIFRTPVSEDASRRRRAWHTAAEPRRSVLRAGRSCASMTRQTAGVRPVCAGGGRACPARARWPRRAEQIAALADAAGGEAAQILEFQVALLDDEDFLDPIFAAVRAGMPADTAWSSALDEQIADYNSAPDEYLQARSVRSRGSARSRRANAARRRRRRR